MPVGKKSFTDADLLENFKSIAGAIVRAKPASAKGTYIKSVVMSTSMGPGVKLDVKEIGGLV